MNDSYKTLKLDVEQLDAGVVVRVVGSVSIQEAALLRDELTAIAAQKVPFIVLDLEQMDFICSSGLGAIILAHVRIHRHDGEIRIVNPQPAVRQVLETTRLTKLFPIFSSLAQATAP